MPCFGLADGNVKIPAGRLIEQCGWKGHKRGGIGVHEKQALVLVNFGEGSGDQIKSLAEEIQEAVKNKFQVDIYPEVNFI